MSHQSGPAQPESAGGLFRNRVAVIAAATELLPGEADLDALDAEHSVVAFLALLGRAPVRDVGNAVLADLPPARRAVDAFDAKRLAGENACHVAAVNLPA